MGTEAGADPAMPADDRFPGFFIEIDGPHNAGVFTLPAAYAAFGFQRNAAAGPFFEGVARADFQARGFFAAEAHYRDKTAVHTAR